MSAQLIGTLVAKDLSLFFRNRFFAFITVLGLVFYIAMYFLLPSQVDETLELALYAPDIPVDLLDEMEEDGLEFIDMDSEEALKEAVMTGDIGVGVALPENLIQRINAGELPEMRVYFTPDVPAEFREIYVIMAQELAFMISGAPLYLEAEEEILGVDMAGRQIPPRDRMLPMLAVFILMMETMGLASLISTEVEAGTIRALLITPVGIPDLFLAKSITGVTLAFTQATLLMLITGGLSQEPVLVLLTLLLGSMLVTGIGFLVASVSRDMMSVLGWGILALLIMIIPSMVIFLPGIATNWIEIIPTYYLVDTVYRVLNFGAGWGDVWQNLAAALLFAALFVGLGIAALRRKFT
jgi:ABC-2 type transport system permease protein